ncbi:hypothetical protein BJ165DRAFT_922892 [Panaeolus papilionaceus]|nr:hypothetical protein BJ165DRAFT_922892 [Panaeolus papilionaceus]
MGTRTNQNHIALRLHAGRSPILLKLFSGGMLTMILSRSTIFSPTSVPPNNRPSWGHTVFWSLDGPITPKDVKRLVHFGKHVRKVTAFIHHLKLFKPPQRVARDVYTGTISALDGVHVLPNLQILDLLEFPHEDSKSCIVPLLISTRLSNISLLNCEYLPTPPTLMTLLDWSWILRASQTFVRSRAIYL